MSRVRGVSEWIPQRLGMALLLVAAGDGDAARADCVVAGARGVRTDVPEGAHRS